MRGGKILLLSGGRVVKLAALSATACERLAVEQLAETGRIPDGLWHALTEGGRERLQALTLKEARILLGIPDSPVAVGDNRISGTETWHPCGRRLGPVCYEQRVNGKNTGLFFVVARHRYWLIASLIKASRIPVVGCLAGAALRRVTVHYQWTWLHSGPRGVA